MPIRKTKKRKKSVVMRGRGQGTHGGGARKKRKKSGHHGGAGMSGTGKRADHKKTLITKLYGHGYFGKQGITSKKEHKDKRRKISLNEIEMNLEKYGKKMSGDGGWNIEMKNYKILASSGKERDYKVKNKIVIVAGEASKSAAEAVKKAGGEIILKKSS